jgi:hypothetical protein
MTGLENKNRDVEDFSLLWYNNPAMPKREGDKVEMQNRQETLLRTYEVCNQDSNAMVRNYWAATAAFLSVNTGVLAWLAKTAISSDMSDILANPIFSSAVVTVVGLAIISITVFLWLWLKSTNRRIHINNTAMVLIERELGIFGKERIADILDRPDKDKNTATLCDTQNTQLNKEIENKDYPLTYLDRKYLDTVLMRLLSRYPKHLHIGGSKCVKGIYLTLISVWGLIVAFSVAHANLVIIHHILHILSQFAR